MPKGDTKARDLSPAQKRTKYLGQRGASDPYMTYQEGVQKTGKDSGMATVSVSADTSGFQLDQERAKDARNWEYWYKQRYGTEAQTGTYKAYGGGKDGEEYRRSNQSRAIERSAAQAKKDGQIQYEIDTLRAETKRLKDLTAYREEASTPFSSQKAAMGLRAAQARSRRGQARGLGLRRRSYNRVANLG